MESKNTSWKKSYTGVLVANAIYILIFYLVMEVFS